MAGRSRDQLAAHEAEALIKELGIDSLPVDPAEIAQYLRHPGSAENRAGRRVRHVGASRQRLCDRLRNPYRQRRVQALFHRP